jgi:hypothetical protein
MPSSGAQLLTEYGVTSPGENQRPVLEAESGAVVVSLWLELISELLDSELVERSMLPDVFEGLVELSLAESIESASAPVLVLSGAGVDSSVRALRDVVLVVVRVSRCDAPERSLVTAPISEVVPLDVEPAAADGVVSVGLAAPDELELVLGTVELLLVLVLVLVLGDGVDELGIELEVLGAELLGAEVLLDDGVDDGGVPSAVRHSELRCVSVVVLELLGVDDEASDDD